MVNKEKFQCYLPPEKSEKIKSEAESLGLSQGDFLEQLIDNFEKGVQHVFTEEDDLLKYFFGIKTVEDRKTVEMGMKLSGLSFKEFAAKALLRDARGYLSREAQMKKVEKLKDGELINSTLKGVVEARVLPVLEKIISYNDAQPEKINKFCINTSLLAKASGSNYGSVKKVYEKYRVMIDDHNQKHGLEQSDNRKGKGSNLDIREIVKDV